MAAAATERGLLRAGPARLVLASLSALFVLGCQGESSETGLDAWMRVSRAQYVTGSIDDVAETGGPAVTALLAPFKVVRGAPSATVSGEVANEASAVLVGLRGDSGHWVLRVTTPDPVTEQPSTFSGAASLSPEAPTGAATVVARAVDLQGRIGPPRTAALSINDQAVPAGAMVISLDWDTEADLDLRVTGPDTRGMPVEIWSKRRLSLAKVPPGDEKPDAAEIATAGELTFDSNSQCVIDGRRQEDVVWKPAAPAGSYTVRVDAFSLCVEPTVRWRARVFLNGSLLTAAQGQMTETDTRGAHGAGAGLTVLTFKI